MTTKKQAQIQAHREAYRRASDVSDALESELGVESMFSVHENTAGGYTAMINFSPMQLRKLIDRVGGTDPADLASAVEKIFGGSK